MKKLTGPVLIAGPSNVHVDILYATGFLSGDPVVYLRKGFEQFLLVSRMELARADRVSKEAARRCSSAKRQTTVLTVEDLSLKGERHTLESLVLALLRKFGIRRVTVPRDFPYGAAHRLVTEGVDVRPADGPLFPERAVKSPWEFSQIKRAQRAAVAAMKAAVALFANCEVGSRGFLRWRGKPLTSDLVRIVVERVLLDHGCRAMDTIVAGGAQSADPHERGEGELRACEPIVIDIFPCLAKEGYWGDLTRTVVKGRPTAEQMRMYRAVRAAQVEALAAVRDGVACSAVHERVLRTFESRGFVTETREGRPVGFIHSTGHGVGLAIHESPHISRNPTRLRAGNIITIEPGLYYPEPGGVRIEDTVLVTRTGWRYLARCSVPFVV